MDYVKSSIITAREEYRVTPNPFEALGRAVHQAMDAIIDGETQRAQNCVQRVATAAILELAGKKFGAGTDKESVKVLIPRQ